MQSKQIQEAATVAYIEDQFKSEDPTLIQSATGNLARLYGMTTLSQLTGLARPSLYPEPVREREPVLPDHVPNIGRYGLHGVGSPQGAEAE